MEYKEIKASKVGTASGYRPDIDGMRALAILAVVIFHAFPTALRGGFVGVDIFFVISGYLISGIIFKGLDVGNFSFGRFYAHRVKRIFPALMVVLPCVFALGWFLLLPDEFSQLGKHIASSVAYVQNFSLSGEAGYFDTASDLKPLTHMWSLAVEEQFYLLFPLIMFCAYRMGFNLLSLVVLGAGISFYLNIRGVRLSPATAYYLPQIRFWELMAGSVLAWIDLYKKEVVLGLLSKLAFNPLFFTRPPNPMHQRQVLCNLISLAGLGLIGVSLLVIEQGYSFPGWWGIGPVGGAFLIIFSGPDAWVNRRLLSNRFAVFIGLISYPLYLWHWPLLSFAHIVASGVPSELVRSGIVLLSLVLAWLTYRLIERPVRSGQNGRFTVMALVSLSVIIGAIGVYTWKSAGFPARLEPFMKVSKAAGEWDYPGRLKWTNFNNMRYLLQPSGTETTTLYMGDSNIEQYYPRVEQLIKSSPELTNSAIFKTGGGCTLIPGLKYDERHAFCNDVMRDALELVKTKPEIQRVVIGAQWSGFMSSIFKSAMTPQAGEEAYAQALNSLSGMIRDFVRQGKTVYLVTGIPIGSELDPKYIAQRDLKSFPQIFKMRTGGLSVSGLEKLYGRYRRDLIKTGKEAGATVIDPVDYLCTDRCESLDDEGSPKFKDWTHLRPAYVREHVDFLDKTILR